MSLKRRNGKTEWIFFTAKKIPDVFTKNANSFFPKLLKYIKYYSTVRCELETIKKNTYVAKTIKLRKLKAKSAKQNNFNDN